MAKRRIGETFSVFKDRETHPDQKKVCKDAGKQPEGPVLDMPLRRMALPVKKYDNGVCPDTLAAGPSKRSPATEDQELGVTSWSDLQPYELHTNDEMHLACEMRGDCEIHHRTRKPTWRGGIPGMRGEQEAGQELCEDSSFELSDWSSNILSDLGSVDLGEDANMKEHVESSMPEFQELSPLYDNWDEDSKDELSVEELEVELKEMRKDRDKWVEKYLIQNDLLDEIDDFHFGMYEKVLKRERGASALT